MRIDPLPLQEAVAALERLAISGCSAAVHLCNADNLSRAARDPAYARVLNAGDLNLPDGAPLVALARWSGASAMRQSERPRGADLMALTFDRGRARRLRHYLYGSDSVTLARLVERLGDDYPGAEIVGLESPPFRALTPDELEAASERLASARPHIVWVALGTPRQDDAIAALRDHVDATMVAVGAAFDFLARTKGVSPAWMQRSGLEWTFRLASEPRRLWRRYLFGNAAFVACAARGIRVLGEGPGGSNEPGPATAGGGDTDRP